MRPLKLTISAFGPYAGQHTIDFTTLKEKNIFLITGPTGAGKTTIFDAISYSLFGEASGSSRDKDSLRSDFAALDIQTFVELEFELRGERYIINRSPQQEVKKARGEGTVIRNADASLILPSGDIVTKVTNVENKMGEILGINKNQFRQIVMLPQGEFRKLLESDSQEREGIFRKIFGTEAFESVQKKLIYQRKNISDRINEAVTQRNTHVKHIDADEALVGLLNAKDLNILEIIGRTGEFVEKDKLASEALNKELKNLKEKQETIQKEIFQATENNKKLYDKVKLQERYAALRSREDNYENKSLKLKNGRKTLEIKTVEDYLRDISYKLKEKKDQYFNAEKKLTECTNHLNLCKEQLEKENAKEEQIKRLSDIRSQLLSKENKVKEYEERNSKILEYKKELEQNVKALEQLKKRMDIEKDELETVVSELKSAHEAELQREKLNKELVEIKSLNENINDVLRAIEKLNFMSEKHKKQALEFKSWDAKYQNYKAQIEEKEENFKRGRAGLLALDLTPGESCPVCGSTTHPSPAKMLENVPKEEELKKLKEKLQLLTDERQRKYDVLTEQYGQISSIKNTIPEQIDKLVSCLGENLDKISIEELPSYLNEKLKGIKGNLSKIIADQDRLSKLIERKILLQEREQVLNGSIKNSNDKVEILLAKEKELFGKVKSEEEFLKGIENEVPIEIRSYEKLSFKINELSKSIKAMEDSYKKALEAFSAAEKDEASALTDKKAKYDSAVESQKEVNSYKQQLKDKIQAAGFENYEKYIAMKMSEKEIKALEEDINTYYQELKAAEEMYKQAEAVTAGLKEILIDDLVGDSEKNKRELKELEDKDKVIYTRINNNLKALEEINKISELIKVDEQQYSIIAELANVANGDNQQRVTFERYVLAAYFDEIIDAANIRLDKMAGGRFILKRKEEKGKGRKQEGLELEVFDNYTGKARHVKTLSGGESFKASLALALGLADVVQSHAGGISLDTMFVDEGFGTLDPESLDMAIKCLIDLQENGRLVGIISHVPELKERIDARLEITPAKEGSRARFIV